MFWDGISGANDGALHRWYRDPLNFSVRKVEKGGLRNLVRPRQLLIRIRQENNGRSFRISKEELILPNWELRY
jgi:hypothetical protein